MSDDLNQSLLPPNASALLKDLEVTSTNCFNLPTLNRYVVNPNLATNHILPWLAWALSVDDWSDNWSEEIRRNVIKASINVHKKKGTIGALKAALEAFNYRNIQVEEWSQYGGEPYYFRASIKITDPGFDINQLSQIKKLIESSKNARSHLEYLRSYLTTESNIPQMGIFLISKEITIIYPK